MINSIVAAQIIGPVMFLASVHFIINKKQYAKLIDDLEKSTFSLLISSIIMMGFGIWMILFHNIWSADWAILVTIAGWGSFLKGVIYLLFPESTILIAKRLKKSVGSYWLNVLIGVTYGLALIWFGYFS
jgi:hypothetical protein